MSLKNRSFIKSGDSEDLNHLLNAEFLLNLKMLRRFGPALLARIVKMPEPNERLIESRLEDVSKRKLSNLTESEIKSDSAGDCSRKNSHLSSDGATKIKDGLFAAPITDKFSECFFWLDNFPMPPSSNAMYASVRGRLIKSKEGRTFESEYKLYELLKRPELLAKKTTLLEACNAGYVLKIDAYFLFPKEKLFTKQNVVKKMDANNRLKPALDGLSYCLGIDDKMFFSGTCEKIETTGRPKVKFRISLMRHRNDDDLDVNS